MIMFRLLPHGISNSSYTVLCSSARRVLGQRGCATTEKTDSSESCYTVTLTVDSTFKNDRFRICAEENGAVLTAANDCALHAAFGRLLRASEFDGKGGFTPLSVGKCIDFTPKNALRGMYFATHFHNFYHTAPLEEVFEVIEDIALYGANNLLVWFDMHHFSSMRDPEAVSMTERLRTIILHANKIGMGASLTMLSNEAFSSSPSELRAEWAAQNGYTAEPMAHYHVELCPSKDGAIAEILRERREMLEAFADLDIQYVVYWPYDQGGCTCSRCAPWGSNGNLKLFPHFKALIHKVLPQARIIFSAWYYDRFTSGEWDGLRDAIDTALFEDIPYLMAYFFDKAVPPALENRPLPPSMKLIDFPEISMYSCSPWGGYGASHLAAFLSRADRASENRYCGGFPYSEGIFEDANKFIKLASYTGEYENTLDALRAYVKYSFCCADDALFEAIRRTETALSRKRSRTGKHIRTEIQNAEDVLFVYETMTRYHDGLPSRIANSRAFRLFYLRAVIDFELTEHDGYAVRSARAQKAFRELCALYHVTDETNEWVKPPIGL